MAYSPSGSFHADPSRNERILFGVSLGTLAIAGLVLAVLFSTHAFGI